MSMPTQPEGLYNHYVSPSGAELQITLALKNDLNPFLEELQKLAGENVYSACLELGHDTAWDYLQELIDGEAINDLLTDYYGPAREHLKAMAMSYLKALQFIAPTN